GERLVQPFGICAGNSGEFFITDTGCLGILGVNPSTGQQRVVSSGGILGVPFGIAAERDGNLLVANAQVLLRVNPETGAQSLVSSNNYFKAPLAVAVTPNGTIFVADALGLIIQVDPATGAQ